MILFKFIVPAIFIATGLISAFFATSTTAIIKCAIIPVLIAIILHILAKLV